MKFRIWPFFKKPTPVLPQPQKETPAPVPVVPVQAVEPARKSPPVLPSHLDEQDQARRLLAIAVSRQATQFISHVSTARIKLTAAQLKEGIKARIVGKEGRNARFFEEKAGVDLLLNEEPDSVVISCFDSFRREVARVALENLIRDGRIQLSKIEEILAAAKTQVDQDARNWGAKAVKDLGIENIHPAIIRVLGTLKFRHSFGQNQLEHSIETAGLCGNLAAELGFDTQLARRAGLLHDLGKALDQTHDGGHAHAGAEFAKKYGEKKEVVQAIASHHEEQAPTTWLDHLVIAADALSGARPGARHGSTETVLDRSEGLEKIASEFPGVTAAYAVQAGREVRVFVNQNQVQDSHLPQMARDIANRIETELRFPGQIKVTVLREFRVTEVASR